MEENHSNSEMEIDKEGLTLSAIRALLCEVRDNMRKISIKYDKQNKVITLYVIYDTPPDQEQINYDIEGTILTEMISDFPDPFDYEWNQEILIIPYPKAMPKFGTCIYQRYEPAFN